jgi:hypothetical protein
MPKSKNVMADKGVVYTKHPLNYGVVIKEDTRHAVTPISPITKNIGLE